MILDSPLFHLTLKFAAAAVDDVDAGVDDGDGTDVAVVAAVGAAAVAAAAAFQNRIELHFFEMLLMSYLVHESFSLGPDTYIFGCL